MKILGIETSCDETAASLVQDGRWILSHIVASSLKEHSRYGGIIPEIASRRQLELIQLTVERALKAARCPLKSIDAIAVTIHPGLIGSLLVGASFARALSLAMQKPLIEVDHIKAHLYASFLSKKSDKKTLPKLPAIGLVVSGGHTSLFYMRTFRRFALMGQTRDDAIGEAFDKVARILGLGYPGGPAIDRLARKCSKPGISFSCAQLPGTLDFSFSGIKTAVLYHTRKQNTAKNIAVEEVVYAFQRSAVDTLIKKSIAACRRKNAKTLLIGGGVAANSYLRKSLKEAGKKENIEIFVPNLSLCMDNASMVAGYGYHLIGTNKKRTITRKRRRACST